MGEPPRLPHFLEHVDVSVPLSPDLLLFGRFEEVPPSGEALPLGKVALMNGRALVHGVRYAASQTEDLVWDLG
jgi:hypothetical protein